MSPADLLAFEARWPGNSPSKRERVRRDLGLSEIRYYQLLLRAAASAEGIAADPFTARRVRERAGFQRAAPSDANRLMTVEVTSVGEPSDAAWRRFGDLAAEALVRLALRDAEQPDAESPEGKLGGPCQTYR